MQLFLLEEQIVRRRENLLKHAVYLEVFVKSNSNSESLPVEILIVNFHLFYLVIVILINKCSVDKVSVMKHIVYNYAFHIQFCHLQLVIGSEAKNCYQCK